ncbi:alpha/beta fold hydrolase [Devosia sp.]|uniref:alpha/beta fold hydrolase n=1 Tax=Devosia sp. TaxID=1871048 RepID=UPI002FC6D2F7
MTSQTQSATLKVPGATLYYETTGAGPTLLIIPGGPQDAGVFTPLAAELSTRFTVVSYDPRGNSRSSFDGAPTPLDVDQQADDAAALIAHIGGPAYVFGTSGGAQIGLNLAARHPHLVTALVAHEPPSIMLMNDPAPMLAANRALYETYKSQGVDAAMAQFFGQAGLDGGDAPEGDMPDFDPANMPPDAAETFMRVSGNFEYWLAQGMLPLSNYTPDVTTLKAAGAPKVIVAIGEQSTGHPIHEMTMALASALGVAPVAVPGDHMGFETEPAEFARRLETALR